MDALYQNPVPSAVPSIGPQFLQRRLLEDGTEQFFCDCSYCQRKGEGGQWLSHRTVATHRRKYKISDFASGSVSAVSETPVNSTTSKPRKRVVKSNVTYFNKKIRMEKDAVEDLGTDRESSDPAIENLDSGNSQGAFEGTLDRVDDDREALPQDVDERSNSHVCNCFWSGFWSFIIHTLFHAFTLTLYVLLTSALLATICVP